MTFRMVIHLAMLFGGVFDAALGGGASNAPRKEEYVTSIDFRMDKSARRRSGPPKWVDEIRGQTMIE
jgi:hypothetical protein